MKLRLTYALPPVAVLMGGTASAETLRWGASHDIYSLDPYSYGDSYTIAFLNHVC